MAKSSKPSPRKKTSSSKQKAAVSDAEIVDDAKDAAGNVKPSAIPEVAGSSVDVPEDHEPMDSEVDDVVAKEPSSEASPTEEKTVVVEDKGATDSASSLEESESSEPTTQTLVASVTTPAPAGLFPSVIGGVIAGALGFGAAMLTFPDGWREQENAVVTNLQSQVAEQRENFSDLSSQVGNLGDRLDTGLDTLKTQMSERARAVIAVSDRLDRLSEGDGITALPDDVQILLNAQKEKIAALSEEVAGMAAAAKAQMDAAAEQQETAEQAEARVKARAAMQDIRLALVSGAPFAESLEDVSSAVEVPDGLQAVAENGVPTQADIQQAYPDAARAALSKGIREEAGDDTQSRISLFFKDQLGARSLTPQEGNSVDAILSRAEAAVKAEDLAGALNEIENLPDVAKAEFADWQASASARMAAVDGFETVSNALNGN